jgi:hypothetical protein
VQSTDLNYYEYVASYPYLFTICYRRNMKENERGWDEEDSQEDNKLGRVSSSGGVCAGRCEQKHTHAHTHLRVGQRTFDTHLLATSLPVSTINNTINRVCVCVYVSGVL